MQIQLNQHHNHSKIHCIVEWLSTAVDMVQHLVLFVKLNSIELQLSLHHWVVQSRDTELNKAIKNHQKLLPYILPHSAVSGHENQVQNCNIHFRSYSQPCNKRAQAGPQKSKPCIGDGFISRAINLNYGQGDETNLVQEYQNKGPVTLVTVAFNRSSQMIMIESCRTLNYRCLLPLFPRAGVQWQKILLEDMAKHFNRCLITWKYF